MVDQLLAQVTPLETQIGVLNSTIMDVSTELHARSLSLERTSTAMDDFQRQTATLTRKLEGKNDYSPAARLVYITVTHFGHPVQT
jgi:hypothetical protein